MAARRISALALACLAAVVLVGCAADVRTFPANPHPDYQLGGAYTPAAGVNVVARDRTADPLPGVYSICYLNAFQTQPGESADWDPDLLLRDDAGEPVTDPEWPDENLLDISTADKRARIAERVGAWIDECADDGFAGVEFDNLDVATRSDGRLADADALDLAGLLVDRAHGAGLQAGQKNYGDHAAALRARGFDFAVAEECAQYDECSLYTRAYGAAVIDIEYVENQDVPFADVCAEPQRPEGIVLRDRDLAPADADGHVAQWCP